MTLRDTLERIASQREAVDPNERAEEAAAFDAALGSLLDAMARWLDQRVECGMARLCRSRTIMREEGYPTREVPTLEIEVGDVAVAVIPAGVQVVAASGRVDMALCDGDGPRLMILLGLDGRREWRAGWKGGNAFSPIDGPLFLSALDRLVRKAIPPKHPSAPESTPAATPRPDGIALLRRIVEITGSAEALPGSHQDTLRAIRGDLEAALADPVRDALAHVLQALDGAPTDSYAIRLAGIRAVDGLRTLGEG